MQKSVKIITCHNVYNYGASLQAYALSAYIKKLGHSVEIIDYMPDYLVHYSLSRINNQKYNKPVIRELYQLAKLPGRIIKRCSKRKKAFDGFTKNYLPLTPITYRSDSELTKNPPKADVYIAGSDQIWNCLFPNGNDPAFYLNFAPENAIKASYAASFSTNSIPPEKEKTVKSFIENLDFVSVRETSGLDILSKLGIENGKCVLDPVFLLSGNEWDNIAVKTENNTPYVFLYDCDKDTKIGEKVCSYAHKKGFEVYSGLNNRYADRCFEDYGPLEFIGLIKNAETVFSNSFHATAFSVIFEKNFWVFNRIENINSRMSDLTSMLGLSNRMIEIESECAFDEKIDYANIREFVKIELDKSKKYLNSVLENKKLTYQS